MKKYLFFIAVCTVLFVGLWSGYTSLHVQRTFQEKKSPFVLGQQVIPNVTLMLVDGGNTATYADVLASTAFEALQGVAIENHITLKTKMYDFGVFIEEIGTEPTKKEYAWIYFVNGVSGNVAADKMELKMGDTVEWRYMKSTY